jgi:hypothetical protein
MGILRGHCALFDGAFTLPSKRRFPFPSRGGADLWTNPAFEEYLRALGPDSCFAPFRFMEWQA